MNLRSADAKLLRRGVSGCHFWKRHRLMRVKYWNEGGIGTGMEFVGTIDARI